MPRKTPDRNMPVGRLTRVADVLPPPSVLAAQEPTIKVTIALKVSSIQFFKREAQRHHTKYQRMIREVLDHYASRYAAA